MAPSHEIGVCYSAKMAGGGSWQGVEQPSSALRPENSDLEYVGTEKVGK